LKKEGFLKLVSNFNTSGIEYLYHIFELQYKLIFLILNFNKDKKERI